MRIQNYRCLRDVDIRFDDVTTFIGPNGVGKSAVLRALDWFFNGTSRTLTDEDVWADAGRKEITVEVEFCDLTPLDRMALGKYAAGGVPTVLLRRRWEDGSDKLSGIARVFPAFEEIRRIPGAKAQLARYRQLRKEKPELGLPAVTSARAAEEAVTAWEHQHPHELESAESPADTHFFGFAGQAKMTGLFDYVFVSADLRASEEGRDTKGSVIGRIMDQAVDRTEAEEELFALQKVFTDGRDELHRKHFAAQLDDLSAELTREVQELTRGRRVHVSSHVPELALPQAKFEVSIQDGNASTRVDQQGHGFQRALLLTALRVLAEQQANEAGRTVFLALEEPELFQHPVQARVFASVLRALAEQSERGMQISYATHSPYFLEAEGFHQVRRMTRTEENGTPSVRVHSTTQDAVAARLGPKVKGRHVQQNLARVCLTRIPEALFAEAVLLTEGFSDKGLFEGCGLRMDPLNKNGVMVVDTDGKQNIPLPHAILTMLGVPVFTVFDGDADMPDRLFETEAKRDNAIAQAQQTNLRLLEYLGAEPEDWPATGIGDGYAVFHNSLEIYLDQEWPSWTDAKKALVEKGVATDKKNEHTYRQAAIDAETNPPGLLAAIVGTALQLARSG